MTAPPSLPPAPAAQAVRSARAGAWRVAAVFLGVAFAALIALAVFNVVMDARGEFPFAFTESLTPVDVPIKVKRFEALDRAPDVLVLGSSRVMTIGSAETEQAGLGRGFNFGLSAAIPADMLAAYRYAAHEHGPPRVVLAGVEADQFTADRAMRLETRRSSQLGPYTGTPLSAWEWIPLVPASLTRDHIADSFTVLRYTLWGYPPRAYTFDDDGYRHVRDREVARAQEDFDVREVIARDLWRYRPTYENLTPPTADHLAALRALVDEARADGARVDLVLTPSHPDFLAAVADTPLNAAHAELRASLAGMCGEGIRVFDMLEVDTFGGDPAEFDDPVHYTRENAARLVRAVRDGHGDLCADS